MSFILDPREYELAKQRWPQEEYIRAHQNANPYNQGLMQSSPQTPQRSQEPQTPQEPTKDKRVLLCVSVPIPDSYHHTTRSIEFDTETETFTENYWDWSDPTTVSLQTLRNTLAIRGAAGKYFLDWYSQHAPFLYPADRRLLLL